MLAILVIFIGFTILMLSTEGLTNGSGLLLTILLFILVPVIITVIHEFTKK